MGLSQLQKNGMSTSREFLLLECNTRKFEWPSLGNEHERNHLEKQQFKIPYDAELLMNLQPWSEFLVALKRGVIMGQFGAAGVEQDGVCHSRTSNGRVQNAVCRFQYISPKIQPRLHRSNS